jgi:hypothetical protein
MKLVKSLIVAAVVAVPALSFAQSNQPVTRAQVRQQLIELEQSGYNPSANDIQYPRNIEQAEAKLQAQQSASGSANASDNVNASGNASDNGYGGSTAGTSASGAHAKANDIPGLGPIYSHS